MLAMIVECPLSNFSVVVNLFLDMEQYFGMMLQYTPKMNSVTKTQTVTIPNLPYVYLNCKHLIYKVHHVGLKFCVLKCNNL